MATIKYYGRPTRELKYPSFIPPALFLSVTFRGNPVTLRGQLCVWTGQPITAGS